MAHSISVQWALEAASILQEQDVSAEVRDRLQALLQLPLILFLFQIINLRSIRPLDVATIKESLKKTNRLVTVETGWPLFGSGAEIAASMIESMTLSCSKAPLCYPFLSR